MKKYLSKAVIYIFLIFMSVIFTLPLLVTLTNSFMSETVISFNYTTKLSYFDISNKIKTNFIDMCLIPNAVTLSQYKEVLLNQPSFIILLINSIKITFPVVLGNIIISLSSAYGFTVWKWKYKEVIFYIYIIVMLMPLQSVLVPNYIIADKMHILNSYLAIILPGIFAPFGTFLLRQNMKNMPREYFEAAEIDGAGHFYAFLHIVIPQMKSGISALCMLVFIEYWNLVEQAVIFIKDYFREPLSVYLSRLSSGMIGITFAASCIYMFLPLLLLIFGQEDLEAGIELSGIK